MPLFQAACAADDAFHAALVAEYGPNKRRILEMRYRMNAEYPPHIHALWLAKRAADDAMHAAMAQSWEAAR